MVSVAWSTSTPSGLWPTATVGHFRAHPETVRLLHRAIFTTDTVSLLEFATYKVWVVGFCAADCGAEPTPVVADGDNVGEGLSETEAVWPPLPLLAHPASKIARGKAIAADGTRIATLNRPPMSITSPRSLCCRTLRICEAGVRVPSSARPAPAQTS